MTAAELLTRISSRELEEWRALYRIEDAQRKVEAEQGAVAQPEVEFTPSLA